MKNIQNILVNKRKLIAIIAILAVTIAVPLTVFISQKQQDLRQRASEKDVSFLLSSPTDNTINLELDTKNNVVNGFDVTIDVPQGLRPTRFTPNLEVYQTLQISNAKIDGQKIRFYAMSTDTNKYFQSNFRILLGQLNYEAENNVKKGNYDISIEKAEVVSPVKDDVLSFDSNTLTFVITPTPASSAAVVSPAAKDPTPPPAATFAIKLENAYIDESNSGANLVVKYSKNFNDCVTLTKISNPPSEPDIRFFNTPTPEPSIAPTSMHCEDLFCENGSKENPVSVTVPFSKFTSKIGAGMKIELCHGASNLCPSGIITISLAPIRLGTTNMFSIKPLDGKDQNVDLGESVLVTIPIENYSAANDYRVVPECSFTRPSGIVTSQKGWQMIVGKGKETSLQVFFVPPQRSPETGKWTVTKCSIYQSFSQTNRTIAEPIFTFSPLENNTFNVTGQQPQ